MHVLVTGGSGLIGWDLIRRLLSDGHEVTYTYHTNVPLSRINVNAKPFRVDIRDEQRVTEVISRSDPEVVVHAAAMTDVDECERTPAKAEEVNVKGTRNVVKACEEIGATVVFFSTSFVFDSDGDRVTEDSQRRAVNYYGRTKIKAEDLVSNAPFDSIICRIDQPYCWSEMWQTPTFVTWVLDRCVDGTPFPVFSDWHNTPVYVPDCNDALIALLEAGKTGVFHLSGPDYVSRDEWAKEIAWMFGYDPGLIETSSSSDADLPAARPSVNLQNKAICQTLDVSLRGVFSGLKRMVERRPSAVKGR
ncbi:MULTISPECIES: SDR family oxidoreductase [unclassified Natrinema]|uniref:SDR family oxidoreductase n=1 Tax=unclassified Natrinema TaxID=2622230 RepID=UPI00026D47E2|nr:MULTISPECIES: SDR family oxidoreductase [unclassified Natrinema]AFO59137.1 dTDP-4-dehydrorhamnose reductase [Natrinema sp. J7-2]